MKRIAFLLALIMLLAMCFVGCNNTENIHQNDDTTVNTTDVQPNSEPHSNNDEHYLCIENDYTTGKKYAVWALKTFELSLSDKTNTCYLETATFGEYAWIFDVRAKGIILYKLSASGEMEVYENIYPEDIGFTEMTSAFPSFYDEDNGFLFFWRDNYYDSDWPVRFLKTTDGGKTWEMREPENPVTSLGSRNYPEMAKFVSENVGVLSYRFHNGISDCGLTYVTTDGGTTWKMIDSLPYPDEIVREDTYSELVDFYKPQYSDEYHLDVKVRSGKRDVTYLLHFQSYDLEEWILGY